MRLVVLQISLGRSLRFVVQVYSHSGTWLLFTRLAAGLWGWASLLCPGAVLVALGIRVLLSRSILSWGRLPRYQTLAMGLQLPASSVGDLQCCWVGRPSTPPPLVSVEAGPALQNAGRDLANRGSHAASRVGEHQGRDATARFWGWDEMRCAKSDGVFLQADVVGVVDCGASPDSTAYAHAV